MDPRIFSELLHNPSESTKLSVKEKRDFVHELSKWSHGALDMLSVWSRKELLEVLCAEMGKERKYTGSTKQKLIEQLLQIVSKKKPMTHMDEIDSTSHQHPTNSQPSSKRQRKTDHPSRLPIGTNYIIASDGEGGNKLYCSNTSCRASLGPEDTFCTRCSCCICYTYDNDKDPTLWLVCSSDTPSQDESCGMTCHLECALQHERSDISVKRNHRLNGNFYCVSCGKVNDLLRYWKKQLLVAKDARRVDILCHRLSLGHKLLDGSEKYQNLHQIVDDAMKKLEAEVGPLNALPTGMARGLVSGLSTGTEVQEKCVHAIELLDSMFSVEVDRTSVFFPRFGSSSATPCRIEVGSTTITVVLDLEDDSLLHEATGCRLWYRKKGTTDYLAEQTYKLVKPDKKFIISALAPDTDYLFKLVVFGDEQDLGTWEIGVTTGCFPKIEMKNTAKSDSPKVNSGSTKTNSSGLFNPSEEGESNNTAACGDLNKLPEDYLWHFERPEGPDGKLSTDGKETSHSQATQEGSPGCCVSQLDEEPNATNRDPTSLTIQNNLIYNHELKPSNENGRTELPMTPSKLEACKDGGRNCKTKPWRSNGLLLKDSLPKPVKETATTGNSMRKKGLLVGEEMAIRAAALEGDYEYSVKVIRWLESKGHIETNFRLKFLTWLSLRATPQERKVVNVFVDTLIDDPSSLAGQLSDTFSEGINSKRPPSTPRGLCMKLWH